MKIGYFFTGVNSYGKLALETTVVVRPLGELSGVEPVITLKLPMPATGATLSEIAAAALAQAQQLVPESAFQQWTEEHAKAWAAAQETPPYSVPENAAQLRDEARFSF